MGEKTTNHNVTLDPQEIKTFCEKHHIAKLSLFGSILTDRFTPDSDVDILVEFVPGCTPGFLQMAALEAELSAMLHRKVDLRTPAELSKYFRDDVLSKREIHYGF
ncbi:MAG: nucleotidyltransferase family protein [Deltaproteobacteria bacterium]|nr:nucleotidyltransferase family protein [Deltaproteobacteria bacterium]MBN2670432.1 nucleotidyltransferase family protein [Deltaproteobacteria bacterium]